MFQPQMQYSQQQMQYPQQQSQQIIIVKREGGGASAIILPGQQQQQQVPPPPPQINPWAQSGTNYQQMAGFQAVDYSGGWNPSVHDNMLKHNINQVFMKHDTNRNGQLDAHEFYGAYHELCLLMGLCPPRSQQEAWQAAMQCDTNRDGLISSLEMFALFKQLQQVNSGMHMQPGMNLSW
jgi:hypothetical protein